MEDNVRRARRNGHHRGELHQLVGALRPRQRADAQGHRALVRRCRGRALRRRHLHRAHPYEHLAVAGDVGKAINPTLVEQQLTGAAVMGIGHTLFDELVYDQGQLTNATLLDYQLPSMKDVPEKLTPIIVESAHRDGPYGAKGVGETGILPIAPAYAGAVRDACGVRITTLPLTPERVLSQSPEEGDERDHAEGQRYRPQGGGRGHHPAARRAARTRGGHQRQRGVRSRRPAAPVPCWPTA